MDFRILGPLEVGNGGTALPLELGGAKQRALLAILILHRGQTATTDRLIEELWGELPPATAAKTLQGYVSRLRKALGNGVLETHGHGYRLNIAARDLDAARFEQLVDDARTARDRGALNHASRVLTNALELWRGEALGDLGYQPSLSGEAARLEELRLTAVEDRADIDLALARHCAAVPELESLVRAHPQRERLRGQLMLALYRSGRQGDALARHQEGRRILVDELGLEPGPELQELEHRILVHDPSLDGPRSALTAARGRGRPLLAAGCVLLAIAIAAAIIELARDGSHSRAALLGADAVGLIGPSGSLVAAAAVPDGPARLAPSGDIVWIASDRARTVAAFNPRTLTVERVVSPGAYPTDLAAGAGALWVLDREHGRLLEVDRAYGAVRRRIPVAPAGGPFLHDRTVLDPWSVAVGAGKVWVTDGTQELIEIDPRRGRVVRRIDTGKPLNDVAASADAIWAISGPSSRLLRIDPARGVVTDRIPLVSRSNVTSPFPLQVMLAAGSVWVLNANTATLSRIDPAQRGVGTTIPVGVEHTPLRLAGDRTAVWVANADGTLARIDPRTDGVTVTPTAHGLSDVAVGAGVVLVSGATGTGTTARAATGTQGTVRALPSTFCSPVYHASGVRPRMLLAADVPLQGPFGFGGVQMSQAIQLLMADRGFRAGRYAVGLQICDYGVPPTDFAQSQQKCSHTARSYAQNPSVIGVIGPFESGCAFTQIPILNAAPRGPLAMLSPSNTVVELTRPRPPDRLYPTGRRNYARIVATDAVQAAADALLASRLGVRRLFVLDDAEPYGEFLAASVRISARRLGVASAGKGRTDAPARALRADLRRSRADGVFVGGYLTPTSGRLLATIRQALGPSVPIIAPDGFYADRLADQVGPAGEGLFVSTVGMPVERLSPSGTAFARRLQAATGSAPLTYAIYAAQATQVMLDAIARSDGTRASVTREMFRTKVRGGLIGDFAITPTGDTTAGAIAIYRVNGGRRRVDRVITPPPRLIR
jgi:DNA-binding SARP family transcriptional activator/streptogramin lyase